MYVCIVYTIRFNPSYYIVHITSYQVDFWRCIYIGIYLMESKVETMRMVPGEVYFLLDFGIG